MRGTGITVSRVSLGTMTFGQQTDEATAIRMVDMAIDAGVNLIDTADIYVKGRSEETVGKALKGKRHQVVLASKVCNFVGEDRRKDSGLHKWHVIRGVEASLKRLQTDCLDIYYMHKPDDKTPIERKRWRPSTFWCAREKFSMWGCPTMPPGRFVKRCGKVKSTDGRPPLSCSVHTI